MKILDVSAIADAAVSGKPDRPATALIHDSDDARVVVFRIDAGQEVALHTSDSSVMLSVVQGPGFISGPVDGVVKETEVKTGTIVAYEPNELHGMRADGSIFVVVATIAPRPGTIRGAKVA